MKKGYKILTIGAGQPAACIVVHNLRASNEVMMTYYSLPFGERITYTSDKTVAIFHIKYKDKCRT